jgi:hypothetical protein
MKKIAAFTLMELIIGMIVSSIVVGTCYSGYLITSKQYNKYEVLKEEVNNIWQLHTCLTTDIKRAESLTYTENHLTLKNDSLLLVYVFNDSCITRSVNETTDTFHFSPLEINPVFVDETNSNLTKQFSFKISLFNEQQSLYYTKEYDAASLFQPE